MCRDGSVFVVIYTAVPQLDRGSEYPWLNAAGADIHEHRQHFGRETEHREPYVARNVHQFSTGFKLDGKVTS